MKANLLCTAIFRKGIIKGIMKISIITVCLNSEKTIEQTLQSVINQENCDYEYIVIDGKSTDKTLEIIEKYKKYISAVVSESDLGIYDAMNKGISLATGDIIGIINSDDWYEPGIFVKVEECFQTANAEVVYGKLNLIGLNGMSQVLIPSDIEKIRYEMEVPHPTVFVKREIYEKYGRFQLKYSVAADYELLLRFYTRGVIFKYLEYTIANFRLGGISNQKEEVCLRETLEISHKYLSKVRVNKREYFKNIIFHRQKVFLFEKIINESPFVLYEVLVQRLGVDFGDDIVIFGAGNWGQKVCRILLCANMSVVFFVDNDANKREANTNVRNPEILKTFEGVLLIVVEKFSEDICFQIKKMDNPSLYCIFWEEICDEFRTIGFR